MTTTNYYRSQARRLAAERGYSDPSIDGGELWAYRNGRLYHYVDEVLAPRGGVPWHTPCPSWPEACRLLGMLPPARGRE